jgi:hypothetical protein
MFPVTPGRLDRNKQQSINLDAITSFFYGKKVVLFEEIRISEKINIAAVKL